MTPKERAAMQQALEALEEIGDEWGFTSKRTLPNRVKAITALREALAEKAEQEPVVKPMDKAERENWYKEVIAATEDAIAEKERIAEHRALITRNNAIIAASQQPVKELELTDDEIVSLAKQINGIYYDCDCVFARAVIAADRRKNK